MPLEILVVDSDRVRLHAHHLWLTRTGHHVTTIATSDALLEAFNRNDRREHVRLLDPDLLGADVAPALAAGLADDTPGAWWSSRTPHELPCTPGRRTALHCPRPASPTAMARLLEYLLDAETAEWLDVRTVGELLATAPASPQAFVAHFADDASNLLVALAEAVRVDARDARGRLLHTLLGCAGAVGATGLWQLLESFSREAGSAVTSHTMQLALENALRVTTRCLARAAIVYGEALSADGS